jgi:uncharacterized protein YbbK (DUF523 family)
VAAGNFTSSAPTATPFGLPIPRTTVYVVTVDAMHTLTKVPVEQQNEHYHRLQHGAADDGASTQERAHAAAC